MHLETLLASGVILAIVCIAIYVNCFAKSSLED